MNTASSIEHCIVCWGRGACLVMLPWARRAEGNAAGTTAVVAFRVSKQLICSISNVAISKKKKLLLKSKVCWCGAMLGFRWRSHPEQRG